MQKHIKVSNMVSSSGNKVANQFIIQTDDGIYFQSYDSIIAFKSNDYERSVILDAHYWDYSVTTGRYRNIFLNETKKDTELKIKSGEYKLTDLNW